MKNTEIIAKEMQQILNNNAECQAVMAQLANRAQAVGMSAADFEKAKTEMFISLFYMVAAKDANLIKAIGADVYKMFN